MRLNLFYVDDIENNEKEENKIKGMKTLWNR